MLIPSSPITSIGTATSLSRRVNANSQLTHHIDWNGNKLIKKGEC
ncbi:hypothetical protein MCC10033_1536 [Bifidobacterium longum subsp. longum]|nr:hypothetical protein MCC10033_1536 [Bifidobacterium longum subsp. longum]